MPFSPGSSSKVGALPNNTYSSGPYSIEGCGANLPALEVAINEGIRAIPAAIRDANRYGSKSVHGFKAMFKLDDAAAPVVSLMQNIINFVPLPNLFPQPGLSQRPRFACVTPETFHIYHFLVVDPLIFCNVGGFAAFYAAGSAYILICPQFWTLLPSPGDMPLTGRCPEVKRNTFITHPGFEVFHYQSYFIIHELVHFYLQSQSLSGMTLPPEQHHLNGCVWLNVVSSTRNPLSYQAYVASEYTLNLTKFNVCKPRAKY